MPLEGIQDLEPDWISILAHIRPVIFIKLSDITETHLPDFQDGVNNTYFTRLFTERNIYKALNMVHGPCKHQLNG